MGKKNRKSNFVHLLNIIFWENLGLHSFAIFTCSFVVKIRVIKAKWLVPSTYNSTWIQAVAISIKKTSVPINPERKVLKVCMYKENIFIHFLVDHFMTLLKINLKTWQQKKNWQNKPREDLGGLVVNRKLPLCRFPAKLLFSLVCL